MNGTLRMQARLLSVALLLPSLGSVEGCTSHYQRLLSERTSPEHAALLDARDGWPTSLRLYPTKMAQGQPVRVALRETGNPFAPRAIVLIHGCLSDHRTWRFILGSLARDHRLLLVDLAGCGDSDRPDSDALGPAGYSPDAHADRLLQALEAHMAGWDESVRVTLVGHSLGGLIAMRAVGCGALKQKHGRVLSRIDRLVLFAPADVGIVRPCATLERLASLDDSLLGLADFLGILQGRIAAESVATAGADVVYREDVDQLVDALRDRRSRRAQIATLRQALPRTETGPDWTTIVRMQAEHAAIQLPCLIAWGACDEVISVAFGYELAALIPAARLRVMPGCGHSLPTERPLLCAELIQARDQPEPMVQAGGQVPTLSTQPYARVTMTTMIGTPIGALLGMRNSPLPGEQRR